MDLLTAGLSDIASAVKSKKISAKEVSRFFLDRAARLDSKLNAFVGLNPQLLEQAEAIDQRVAKGEDPGVLAGVPYGIKDMFCTKGLRTTAGSKILSNFVPPYDATVVAKIKAAGGLVMGKLNQDEFAMGSSNETSFFGPVKNPWNTDYVPGGSSGGSAAAQASRLCAASLGTDTGGSIRQPASFCGIVGVKPTYGRISRYGIIAYASSLDQAGPMVNSVADAALSLEVLCGKDGRDMTTADREVPAFARNISKSMKGMKVGLQKEVTEAGGLNPDVQKSLDQAVAFLKSEGAEVVEVSIPLTEMAVPIYYLVATSEASSNLARYDGVKYGYRAEFANLSSINLDDFYAKTRGQGFGKEVKRRIVLGTHCLSAGYYDAYYNKACQVRRLLRDQYLAAFKKCDVILSPVATSPAFKLGARISDPLTMYLNDIFTVSTNLAGLPGMSVPFGLSQEGLPIGIQITAAHFEEQKMLNVGAALEAVSPDQKKVPNVY
jgi:aspartyl-tRNA(Asn)/glutamyl-tRNA(Gln) amidotransferase subunit A